MGDLLSTSRAVLRDAWLHAGRQAIEEGIAHVKTRPTFLIAVADRTWLCDFLVFQPDLRWKSQQPHWLAEAFCQGDISEHSTHEWIEEALTDVPVCSLPPLPEPSDVDLWLAVRVQESLYCCGCRCLHEGYPLFVSQVAQLRDELPRIACADCGIDL